MSSLPADNIEWRHWFAHAGLSESGEHYSRLMSLVTELALPAPSDFGFESSALAIDIGLDPEAAMAASLLDRGQALTDAMPNERELSPSAQAFRRLLEGAIRVGGIARYAPGKQKGTESLRRMLIAMIDDVRVVVIQLAVHLAELRQAKGLPTDVRSDIARDTLDIYAPLANRLGIWQLKWEMEDLAFRFTDPDAYHALAARLEEKLVARKNYIERFIDTLNASLAVHNVKAEISGRPKHIYSIYRKMHRKRVDFEDIYDIRAVRILVDEIAQCYTALGVVHEKWPFIRGEFDDYIALPKANGYKSIHTAVVGPDGRTVEVQIRTRQMHEENEYGVAAHWRYKEGATTSSVDNKVLWLRQLLESRDDSVDEGSLFDQFKNDVSEDRVYVLTPEGDIIDLPQGATPIDFAYAVHTQVGHRCRGAKVNGRIVNLTHQLATGDRVAILTAKNPSPSRDWLSGYLGFTKTSRARARIQRWFKEQDYDANMVAGRGALEKEFDRLGVRDVRLETLAEQAGYKKVNDLLAAIGSGDIRMAQVIGRLRQEREAEEPEIKAPTRTRRKSARQQPKGLRVQGVGNLLTTMASCCQPVMGDPISGYITRDRGVTIHRADCASLFHATEKHPERVVLVDWGEEQSTFPVSLTISAFDRTGLTRDILSVLSDASINVMAIESKSDASANVADIRLTIEVPDIEHLSTVLAKIQRVPNVSSVRRVTQ